MCRLECFIIITIIITIVTANANSFVGVINALIDYDNVVCGRGEQVDLVGVAKDDYENNDNDETVIGDDEIRMLTMGSNLIDVVKENLLLVRHLVRRFKARRQLGGRSLCYL